MKHFIKTAVLAALLMAGPCLRAQNPVADSIALLGRVSNLELMRENISREVQLHKQELADQVLQLENQSLVLFILTSAIAGIGTISILLSFFRGVKKAKEKLLFESEGMIEAEVKLRLPKLTETVMQEAIHREMAPLMSLINAQKTKDRILEEATIVLWAEDDDRGQKAMKDFFGVGFKKVSIGTPSETVPPNADLIVFVRQEPIPDKNWTTIHDGFIKKVLDRNKNSEGSAFFYYGPTNEALKPKMYSCLALGNSQHTIIERIVPLLSKRFAS